MLPARTHLVSARLESSYRHAEGALRLLLSYKSINRSSHERDTCCGQSENGLIGAETRSEGWDAPAPHPSVSAQSRVEPAHHVFSSSCDEPAAAGTRSPGVSVGYVRRMRRLRHRLQRHTALELLAQRPVRKPELVVALQVHPELSRCAEVLGQSYSGVRGDAALAVHDLVDAARGAPMAVASLF